MGFHDLFNEILEPPDIFGIVGAIFFLLGVGSVWTGKCPGRGFVTCRTKEPKSFWFGVVIYFLGAAFFIGRFLVDSP
jgi:hypothetical protein